jgi:hypothetical protein
VDDAIRDQKGRKLVESKCKRYWIVIDGHELTSEQVAEMFEVSMRQIRRWAKAGLLEQRTPRGMRKCSACGEEGHYKSSRECPKHPAYDPPSPAISQSSLERGIGRPRRYAPPTSLDLQALGVVLPPDEADPLS